MIDTLRLAYPADPRIIALFDEYTERLQKISPDGEVLWERAFCQASLPSSFSGLRVMIQQASELKKQGFENARSLIFFEFSLQKWQSETGYNNKNTSLEDDIYLLHGWIGCLSFMFDYDFRPELFEFYRVDLAVNYILENGSVPDYLRSLEIKFSRHENGEKKIMRFDGALQYGSRWIGKKLYHKFGEFNKNYFNQHKDLYRLYHEGTPMSEIKEMNNGKRILAEDEIMELSRMLRFEVEFRRMYLHRNKILKIADIHKLSERFKQEQETFMTCRAVPESATLSDSEYRVIDLCKRYSYSEAKRRYVEEKSTRSWYRTKAALASKGVRLEAIVNADWRLDIASADNLKNFSLRVA